MLKQRITSKGQMHTVACLLADDLRDRLHIFNGYSVEKREYDESARVLVYSNSICDILSGACIESCMEVINIYVMQYDTINYHFGTLELGTGSDKRVLPCIHVCLSLYK